MPAEHRGVAARPRRQAHRRAARAPACAITCPSRRSWPASARRSRKLREQMPAYPTTLVMEERPANNPRPTFRHNRGEFLQPQERVEPDVLSALHPLPAGAAAQPPDLRPLAGRSAQPAGRPGDDEPPVGRLLRPRPRAHRGGLRLHRRPADAPRIARLAGGGVRPPRLVAQGDAPPDRDERDLSAVVAGDAGRCWPATRTTSCWRAARACGWRRSCCATRRWRRAACCREQGRRPERLPAAAGERDGRGGLRGAGVEGERGLDRYRRGLYTFSKRTAAVRDVHDLRRPERRGVRRPARAVEHAAASADAAQRRRPASNAPRPWAARRLRAKDRCDERAAWLFRRCLTRPPTDEERAALAKFYRAQKERFERKELDAAKVAGPGAGTPTSAPRGRSRRGLLNLDEFVTKD